MDLELRHQTAHEICASLGPVVIRISDGVRTEVEDLYRDQRLFDELLETHPNIVMLVVMTHGTPSPDGRVQRHAKEFLRRYEDRVLFVAVPLGLGFWASTLRAALSLTVRFVGRGSVWIEGSVEAAIARVTMELVGIDGDELLRAYEQLWAELEHAQTLPRSGTES